ncbi:hypothetical protein D0T50_02870 [Bacteroides sp. 214]|nr:hypothetical protein [Bacteroides sp. 214]
MPLQRLDQLYQNIDTLQTEKSADLYYYIIQIKHSHTTLRNHKNSIYVDIKNFIECYIRSIEKRDFGYDVLNINKIITAINNTPNNKEQLSLLMHAYKILKNNHFEVEAESVITLIRNTKLQILKSEKSYKKHFKILFHLISYNLIAVFLVLLLILLVSYIIFLPAPLDSLVSLEFKYDNYNENFYINHLLNIICYFFDMSDSVQIKPINSNGVLLILIMKSFYIVCIANYLYQIILERLKLNK